MRFTRGEKSPGDDLPWNWDYSDEDVFSADPITSFVATDWNDGTLSGIVVGGPSYASPIVQTRISGGTKGQTYYIKGKATNAGGEDREAFLQLTVRIPTPDS